LFVVLSPVPVPSPTPVFSTATAAAMQLLFAASQHQLLLVAVTSIPVHRTVDTTVC
jgi:hypothetical protein